MKKQKIIIVSLIFANVISAVTAFAFYGAAKMGRAKLDEENHHLILRAESYKSFILRENKGLSPQELLLKYNNPRELTEFEAREELVEINLVYFQFKEGKLNGVE